MSFTAHRAYLLLISTALIYSASANAASTEKNCGGETMPTSQDLVCVQDYGIYPNTNDDLSKVLNSLLGHLSAHKKGLFFPSGDYFFTSDVALRDQISLIGSTTGATVFSNGSAELAAPMFGDIGYRTPITNMSIENIIFDNIYVRLSGAAKRNIAVRHNAFINTNRRDEQLALAHAPYEINGNVFMRGKNYPGVGLSTYRNREIDGQGLVIEGNFLGSPALKSKAAPYVDQATLKLIDKLVELRHTGKLTFDDDQGNFTAGWYATNGLTKGAFRRNFFAGNTNVKLWNPLTWNYDIQRDHNVYIKEYNDVDMIQNYFSGWPDQAAGQLKFRNAQGLVFAGNYLDGISFNVRPYSNSSYMHMRNTFIFNNQLNEILVNDKPSESLISYWQNFSDTPEKRIDVHDYLVFDNIFNTTNSSGCRVTSPEAMVTSNTGQFLEGSNNYANGVPAGICGVIQKADVDQLKAKLPETKRQFLELKPIKPGPTE